MLKSFLHTGIFTCLLVMIIVGMVGLYYRFQQDPGQTALAGLVVAGIIALSVLNGRKK